jgi:hypothetical protein
VSQVYFVWWDQTIQGVVLLLRLPQMVLHGQLERLLADKIGEEPLVMAQ